jgi:hypothetical protein
MIKISKMKIEINTSSVTIVLMEITSTFDMLGVRMAATTVRVVSRL